MPKLLIISGVEKLGNYVKHNKLVMGDLLRFSDESSQHNKDIFLKVKLVSISIGKQRYNYLLDFRNVDWHKTVILAHF